MYVMLKNIVVIGGGTGSYTVLRGLRDKVENLSAVVSMFDDGGSTGLLRDEFGILPPGDVRRCLLALADENGDNTLRELFTYRFEKDSSLKGHSFGNLLLTALQQITGSEAEAIRRAEKILNIKGRVLPVSFDNARLCAEMEDGRRVLGESAIDIPFRNPNLKINNIWLEPKAVANAEAVRAIEEAELIVIGPGDLFTSLIPNFLVKGIKEALARSRAKKVYICNLMTKPGETSALSAADHLERIIWYGVKPDLIICSQAEVDLNILEKYLADGQHPVVIDPERIAALGVELVVENLITAPELIRHDSEKLARLLLFVIPDPDLGSRDYMKTGIQLQ